MCRIPLLLFLVLPLVLLVPPALAGPRVPAISLPDLPEAGTCAPLPTTNVTWVTVGEIGFYRVDNDPRDFEGRELYDILSARSRKAAEAGTPHDVWITAARNGPWVNIVQVLQLCQQTGIFRVGLQVRAESGDGVMGFPLFLPGGTQQAPPGAGTTARLLEVRMAPPPNPLHATPPSNPDLVYAAARNAVERFGPIVAEASVHWSARVHEAVRVVDLLYRAGCAAVKLRNRIMTRKETGPPTIQIWVQDRLLKETPATTQAPPIGPRKTVWPDCGAARPGALAYDLEPLSPGDGTSSPATHQRRALPNYAATGQEVPPGAMRASAQAVLGWAGRMGTSLGMVLKPGRTAFPEPLLARRKRQGLGVQQFFREARAAFPGPERVVVGTTRVQAYLLRENGIVGQIDLTLCTSGERLDVVFGSWVAGEYPSNLTLDPVEVDRFAAGVPGHLRVWVEGTLAAARVRGPGAVPLATEEDVLAQLPAVARAGARRALAGRLATLGNLVGWVRATPFDRLLVLKVEGTAAIHAHDRIEGILRFDLDPEQGELSLASLTPRVAPR